MTVNCVFVDLLDLHFGFFIVYLVAAGFLQGLLWICFRVVYFVLTKNSKKKNNLYI